MNRTVLVVDRDGGVRSLLRALLAERGYVVREAANVGSAFAELDEDPVAVVLDLDLPHDGAQTILDALARRRRPPPVVLCTATIRARHVARRYHVAALSKFAMEAIGDEVDRVIAESRRPRLSRVSLATESRPSIPG